ncbi:DUF4179 domain-containing protein [Planococcus halotolerans]|uniref:DUF4179 domain-containing protein n=1 Tax=Planococcus halotolerans TaxID=2233542 RepID=A0A365L786_9BACL|nr:DUF4179 domain-containing protein [Planococcus halotolerans]RAZ81270.1 hypothetical protein DP120_03000 [Planococcus halotolerans]
MDEKQFEKEISRIEVPQFEVFQAIDKGIKNGRKAKRASKRFNVKTIGAVTSVAASAFLVSGLIFAPVSNVLAAVPVIGSFYEKFGLQIGAELEESGLITQLNQAASSNGVDVTVTSAYYDGNVMGITFVAEGDGMAMDPSKDVGPESGYSFHLFDGDEQNQWAAGMTQLEETEEGYAAAMEFYNPEADLPADFNLPLTFNSIGGVEGKWKFDIPLQQISAETILTNAESQLEGTAYSLHMESIVKGKATTMLNYETNLPLDGAGDEIRLTVFDDLGNRLSKSHANVLSESQSGDGIQQDVRELFSSKIDDEAKYLLVQPEVVRHEDETIHTLDGLSAPFTVESERFDHSLLVNSVEQEGNQVIIDYTIQDLEEDALREELIQNFADFVVLVKSDDVVLDEAGERDFGKLMENRTQGVASKQASDEPHHYQSAFTVDKDFNLDDYSLMAPFGTLSSNQPIEMAPIKVDLTGK